MENDVTKRIVVIDDDPLFLEYMTAVLVRGRFLVLPFADPGAALAAMERDRPDLVIADIFMPDIDGFELLKMLEKRFPGLPLISISGSHWNFGNTYLRAITNLGAFAALPKPIEAGALLAAVEASFAASSGSSPVQS